MNAELEARLWACIRTGEPFTAADVTDCGRLTVNGDHAPNGGQSGIGARFNVLAQQGVIRWTKEAVRSTAPHRKGGLNRVWVATVKGLRIANKKGSLE
jgi:hypothetical protein